MASRPRRSLRKKLYIKLIGLDPRLTDAATEQVLALLRGNEYQCRGPVALPKQRGDFELPVDAGEVILRSRVNNVVLHKRLVVVTDPDRDLILLIAHSNLPASINMEYTYRAYRV